jgi:hypothetical protein
MATIDGRPAQYGISLKQLRDLMEHRGREGVAKVTDYGGVQEICKKLYTSPSEGKSSFQKRYGNVLGRSLRGAATAFDKERAFEREKRF